MLEAKNCLKNYQLTEKRSIEGCEMCDILKIIFHPKALSSDILVTKLHVEGFY